MTYAATEPEQAMMYFDQLGKPWTTREAAIDANFQEDVAVEIRKLCNTLSFECNQTELKTFLHRFIQIYPDMTRVILGDRDAT